MAWYRAELGKDGSVVALRLVEQGAVDTRGIVYFEADTEEEAAGKAQAFAVNYRLKWEKLLADKRSYEMKRRTARLARGLCIRCGAPAEPGASQCRVHLDAQRQTTKRWEARQRGEDVPRVTPAERTRRATETQRERRGWSPDELAKHDDEVRHALLTKMRGVVGQARKLTEVQQWVTDELVKLAQKGIGKRDG